MSISVMKLKQGGGGGGGGGGVLKLRSIISPLRKSPISQKHMLESLNHFHIWQMSP